MANIENGLNPDLETLHGLRSRHLCCDLFKPRVCHKFPRGPVEPHRLDCANPGCSCAGQVAACSMDIDSPDSEESEEPTDSARSGGPKKPSSPDPGEIGPRGEDWHVTFRGHGHGPCKMPVAPFLRCQVWRSSPAAFGTCGRSGPAGLLQDCFLDMAHSPPCWWDMAGAAFVFPERQLRPWLTWSHLQVFAGALKIISLAGSSRWR